MVWIFGFSINKSMGQLFLQSWTCRAYIWLGKYSIPMEHLGYETFLEWYIRGSVVFTLKEHSVENIPMFSVFPMEKGPVYRDFMALLHWLLLPATAVPGLDLLELSCDIGVAIRGARDDSYFLFLKWGAIQSPRIFKITGKVRILYEPNIPFTFCFWVIPKETWKQQWDLLKDGELKPGP